MIYGIYSMRDKLDGYMGLKLEGNDNVAIRNFSILVNDPSLSVSYNPDDFDLYKVGTFDSDSGELCHCKMAELVDSDDRAEDEQRSSKGDEN